ncbi:MULTISPECIES: cation diffusion facilitator family transporter [Mesobacillus]|uniref:Transporter n=2 Tax=Mesobacillus TaxID=2675231 RepID=A0A0D6ZAA6_9BACI|nr:MULTISPECIES: cation diffusion facilitator family transporter [Mesobacillus]KIY22447.1 transporter [Mesobacillus subterraneus]MDQ0414372.1 cation diffusion facilitator family transporter [Mesobacillus stamsii]
MNEQRYSNLKQGERGAMISIAAYILLSTLKLFVGYISGSEALKADGLNNTTDILASISVLIGLRLSQKPADEDHLYGHWKSEMVASMVASFIMVIVGIEVLYSTIRMISEGTKEAPDMIAAWTGLFSAFVMYAVYRYNRNLARKINSHSVMAAAKDNLSDSWVSIGAAVGILGSQFGLPWLDPVTAVIVGLLILKTGWDIFRDASHQLTDGFDVDLIKKYKQTIFTISGVKGINDLKARNYGNNIVVDCVITVNPSLDISTAHDISTMVEQKLMEEFDIYDVHVHVEPD